MPINGLSLPLANLLRLENIRFKREEDATAPNSRSEQGKIMTTSSMRWCLVLAVGLCLPVCAQHRPATPASGDAPPVPGGAKPMPGPLPRIDKPVLFNTPEADRILSHLQIFPPNNPWNEDVSRRPVAENSARMIASMKSRKTLGYNLDMCFIIVPPSQPKVLVKIQSYPGESDPGPYPIPDNTPVEGWPMCAKSQPTLTLDKLQREGDGDRHLLVLDPSAMKLYEMWRGFKRASGWEVAQVAMFDLRSNKTRPNGWTSGDAAGLPIMPAAVRFDECEHGMVNHALRVTVRHTQKAYIYPATHFASSLANPDLPRMGERLRLRQDFDLHSFSPHVQAILKGLKKYGMFVADNGQDWLISITPDERIKGLNELDRVKSTDFEVIVPTGPAGR